MRTFKEIEQHIRSRTGHMSRASVDLENGSENSGIHVTFSDPELLDFSIWGVPGDGLISIYFSSQSNLEWPYKNEEMQEAIRAVTLFIDEYLNNGATLTERYVGDDLVSVKIKIGTSEETTHTKIKFGKRKKIIKKIPPPLAKS